MKKKLFCILTICFSLMLCSCGSFDMLDYKDKALELTQAIEKECNSMIKAAIVERSYILQKVEAGEPNACVDAEILEIVYAMCIDKEYIESRHADIKQQYDDFMSIKIGKNEEAQIIQKRMTELYEHDRTMYYIVYSEGALETSFTYTLDKTINELTPLCEKMYSYCEY